MSEPNLAALRRSAVTHSLKAFDALQAALDAIGFVQADPIRAPARAQDLMLRHRIPGYLAGELERRYGALQVEEAFFINYGFVTPALFELMHPRGTIAEWPAKRRAQATALLAYLDERPDAHPRDVAAHFAHGRVTNYWGGSSSATTHMLDQLHYLGLVRVVRRDAGVRVYGRRPNTPAPLRLAARDIDARLDTLVDVLVRKYAPLPWNSMAPLIRRLRYAVPQWSARLPQALTRAKARFPHATVEGTTYYWPEELPFNGEDRDEVRLLAPFDPIVWDRRRFELFWGWAYRFEAYTPVSKRKLGYYALPLLWRDHVVGWANVTTQAARIDVACGYVAGRPPRERAFKAALEAEVERLRVFLGLSGGEGPTKRKRRTRKSGA